MRQGLIEANEESEKPYVFFLCTRITGSAFRLFPNRTGNPIIIVVDFRSGRGTSCSRLPSLGVSTLGLRWIVKCDRRILFGVFVLKRKKSDTKKNPLKVGTMEQNVFVL